MSGPSSLCYLVAYFGMLLLALWPASLLATGLAIVGIVRLRAAGSRTTSAVKDWMLPLAAVPAMFALAAASIGPSSSAADRQSLQYVLIGFSIVQLLLVARAAWRWKHATLAAGCLALAETYVGVLSLLCCRMAIGGIML